MTEEEARVAYETILYNELSGILRPTGYSAQVRGQAVHSNNVQVFSVVVSALGRNSLYIDKMGFTG